jgi:hypothetical protein
MTNLKALPTQPNALDGSLETGISDQQQESDSSSEHIQLLSYQADESPQVENTEDEAIPCLYGSSIELDVSCSLLQEVEQNRRFRFGHRVRSKSHLLHDIDGMMLEYDQGNIVINGAVGFLASSNGSKVISPNRQLYGLSADFQKLPSGWNLGGYMVNLKRYNQENSSTLGTALRFSQENRSFLMKADYDLQYRTLGQFMLSSAWKLLPSSTLSTSLVYHQRNLKTPQLPYLQNSLALINGWGLGLPTDRIRALSADGSPDISGLGLSLSHLFTKEIKLNSELAVLNVSNQTSSSALSTTPRERNEYYFKITLSGKGLLLPSEYSGISLRSYLSDQFRHAISMVNANYALSSQWNLKPKLQIDYRDNLIDNTTHWTAIPVLKLEYRWRKRSKIHITTTGKQQKLRSDTDVSSSSSYAVNLGYQTAF